jgi:dTDP-4-dehydrorhamnose 3,5-epimerase-like enzyme
MKIEHKKINFKDGRGTITDIFVNSPKDHATIIFSKKGAVRGNHYHKKSTQYDFVVSGQLTVLSQKIGQKKVYKHILKPYDLMFHGPMEAHTLIADKDTVFITFVDGVRGGKNYEKDTFRLEKPIK